MNKAVMAFIMASELVTAIPSGIDIVLNTEPEKNCGETINDVRIISNDSLDLLARVAMAEAGGESELGQRLVIDTVLNRVDSELFPGSIHAVVYQPWAFSSVWNGQLDTCEADPDIWRLACEESEDRTNEEVLFFRTQQYSVYGTPLFVEGNHYFSGK